MQLRQLSSRLKTSGQAREALDFPRLAPNHLVFAVGDIHGAFGPLSRLLAKAAFTPTGVDDTTAKKRLVFLGDYIDRGERSEAVLSALFVANCEFPDRVICLQGNHEQMLLGFLDNPFEWGNTWLTNGGLQTLASFGVGEICETSKGNDLLRARDALHAKMPAGMEAWLRQLPKFWQSGNLLLTHAGANPDRPIVEQDPDDLVWGCPEFLQYPRRDGLWVAHGHNVVGHPSASNGRVSIDSGAYMTGTLSLAIIHPNGDLKFITS